ncbi:MAG: tetratricopeptide repeat protein [Chloroflexi bacterium]|nr:tetratricopeptide repeat protein [Chloroflexota bacterium]
MAGELEEALKLYTRSIELHPTAEAHTFRGWTYSFLGRVDEAIQECQRAIEVDPDFGNPYNDIGAYLIEQDRLDEAIPWLEKALQARRYEARHFPHSNLARVYERKGDWHRAIAEYRQALEIEPGYEHAAKALSRLRGMLN